MSAERRSGQDIPTAERRALPDIDAARFTERVDRFFEGVNLKVPAIYQSGPLVVTVGRADRAIAVLNGHEVAATFTTPDSKGRPLYTFWMLKGVDEDGDELMMHYTYPHKSKDRKRDVKAANYVNVFKAPSLDDSEGESNNITDVKERRRIARILGVEV